MINVGVIVLATGPYIQFVPELIESVRKYFLMDIAKLHFYILTDSAEPLPDGCQRLTIEHAKWPGVNMHRYHSILKFANLYEGQDFLFNFDADLLFHESIGREVLGSFVALISPTAWGWPVDKFCMSAG